LLHRLRLLLVALGRIVDLADHLTASGALLLRNSMHELIVVTTHLIIERGSFFQHTGEICVHFTSLAFQQPVDPRNGCEATLFYDAAVLTRQVLRQNSYNGVDTVDLCC
jgi:hypothetical protein